MIYDHLAGRHTEGIYPLLKDDTCAVISAGEELEGLAALDMSRSGQGHMDGFFSPVGSLYVMLDARVLPLSAILVPAPSS